MSRTGRKRAERRGRRAEAWAALLLRLKGYRILAQRFRAHGGEIDLVAGKGKGLVFIEVKSRVRGREALEAVHWQNRKRIEAAAMQYIAEHPGQAAHAMRFDVMTVSRWGRVRHLRHAWRPEAR